MPGQINSALAKDIRSNLDRANSFALAEFDKVSVSDMEAFRKDLGAKNSWCMVMKNRILNLALKEKGLQLAPDILKTSTLAVMTEGEMTEFAKTLVDLSNKIETFKVKAGYMNEKIISSQDVITISKLPSRDVMLAQLLGQLNAPITSFVFVLQGIIRKFVYVLKAIEEKRASEPEAVRQAATKTDDVSAQAATAPETTAQAPKAVETETEEPKSEENKDETENK